MSKEEIAQYLAENKETRALFEALFELDPETQGKVVPVLTEWLKEEHKDIKELEKKINAVL